MTEDIDALAARQRKAWGRAKKPPLADRIATINERRAWNDAARSDAKIAQGAWVECPAWVPKELRKEWARVLREKDEFAAAAHVRALKRKGSTNVRR